MSPMILILLLVGQGIVCGGFATGLAAKKGYPLGPYFAAGFFFSVLGLILAAGLPPSRLRAERDLKELHSELAKQQVQEIEAGQSMG